METGWVGVHLVDIGVVADADADAVGVDTGGVEAGGDEAVGVAMLRLAGLALTP